MGKINYSEMMAGNVDKVIEKLVFHQIKDAMKPVQELIDKVAKENAELMDGDVGAMQKVLVDTFVNTSEPVVQKEDGKETAYYADLDMFMNSISNEKKQALFMEVFNLFVEGESEKRKGNDDD